MKLPISALWYLLTLAVPFVVGFAFLPTLALAVATGLFFEQAFPGSRTRHLAGALLATAFGLVLMFLIGQQLRLAALLLLVPGMVGVGLARGLGERFVRPARKIPVLTAVAWFFCTAGLYYACGFPTPNDDFLITARADTVPEPLSDAERAAAIDIVQATIDGRGLPADLPPSFSQEPDGAVYVTLLRPARKKRWTRGASSDGSLQERLQAAAKRAWLDAPEKKLWRKQRADLRILVDLAGPEQLIRPSWTRRLARRVVRYTTGKRPRWDAVVYDAEPGVDSFRVEGPSGDGVVLGADVMIHGWTSPRSRKARYRLDNFEQSWKRLMERSGRPPSEAASVPFYNFRTYTFALAEPGSGSTVELYRMNALLEGTLTEAELLSYIDRAGRWLLGTVMEDGRFDYEYFPHSDRHGRGYNEVRHAGSVYGLFHMAHVARSEPTLAAGYEGYVAAAATAMDRVYRNLGPNPGTKAEDGFWTFLEGEDGARSNSGSPSLTLLAFLERPSPDEVSDPELGARLWRDGDDAIMRGLALTLEAMIDEDGEVYQYWEQAQAGGGVQKEPLYFPGEAMLALAKYAVHTGEDRWMEAARRIGRRQIPFARQPWIVPDHWVMQALDVLDEHDETDEWKDGAYAMGHRYIGELYAGPLGVPAAGFGAIGRKRRNPALPAPFPDYRGAYRRVQEVPRTTRAASRGEAIGGVARIAWRHGDPAAHWERSLIEGARHLAEQMFRPENSFYFPNPDEALGAVRMGVIDQHCRIDNNQHAVVGLTNALAAMRRGE